jgi:hypothetical protein
MVFYGSSLFYRQDAAISEQINDVSPKIIRASKSNAKMMLIKANKNNITYE